MPYTLAPTTEAYFPGLHRALDIVARERKYLAFLQAPPFEVSLPFYRNIVANDLCQFVALQGEEVVGWCDVLPCPMPVRTHVGHLGIGLIPSARHQGLGARLMEATLAKAQAKGLTRIELVVRCDNPSAQALYERFGFIAEGVQRRGNCIESEYIDTLAMALLF
ncbi:GNAT family protein [Uliginosibacterium flavum]|uniref:GNAT family N-acetyltransferase n=1 Tax=Uliginosibacterium flavum TaxID=1396831 RepID=A0ABV2TKE0_9RHOO